MSEQIDSAIRWASDRFSACSDSARLDAELLLAHCLDKPRTYLYSWPEETLSEDSWLAFQDLVRQRLNPTPIAYLLGSREFYSMEFTTTPAVLVPRPETELLVDLALQHCPENRPQSLLDLGTGSGIISIILKKHRPLANLLATDIDTDSLKVARTNALRHQVDVEFIESSWFDAIDQSSAFDLIVSNPPYIAADHPFLRQGDLVAEPAIALSPGETGLEALNSIIGGAGNYLRPGGYLITEHGYDQQGAVFELFQANGFDQIACHLDANDLPRVSLARYR